MPLIRARRKSDNTTLAEGFTDQRGEAFVPIIGIPVIDFVTEPVEDTDNGGSFPGDDDENGIGGFDGNGNGNGNGAVSTKTVKAVIEILTPKSTDSWPPNPQAIEDDPQSWIPVSGAMPEPDLQTGKIITENLGLEVKPQP